MNLNKVYLIGNLTRDPELRQTPSGQAVCTFGLATNRVYTDNAGQKQTQTEFHNVVVWARQAEIVHQYLQKGSMALIEGRLQTRNWQDPQGQKHWRTEIISERIQFGPRSAAVGAGGGAMGGNARPPQENQNRTAPMRDNASPRPSAPPQDNIPIIELPDEGTDIDIKDIPF